MFANIGEHTDVEYECADGAMTIAVWFVGVFFEGYESNNIRSAIVSRRQV